MKYSKWLMKVPSGRITFSTTLASIADKKLYTLNSSLRSRSILGPENKHPKSIKLQDLSEPLRSKFNLCRTAIFNNDYPVIIPLLEKINQSTSVILINGLLEALGKMGKLDEMVATLSNWMEQGGRPSNVTMEILTDYLLLNGRADEAKKWNERLLKEYRLLHGISLVNLWITFHLRQGDLSRAKELFQSIVKLRLRPNQTTFTSFYRYFFSLNDFEGAEETKKSMLSQHNIRPDISFYNMQLRLMFGRKMVKEADLVVEEMREKGVWMDNTTYDLLVAGNAASGRKPEMEKWLWERNKQSESKMSQRSYSKLIEAMGMNLSAEECRDMFSELASISQTLNVYVYFALVISFLKQERYDEVTELFKEIQRIDLVMPSQFYIRLARTALKAKFQYGVQFCQDEMQRHCVTQPVGWFDLLLKEYLHKDDMLGAQGVLEEMLSKGVSMAESTLSVLLTYLLEKNHIGAVQDLIVWVTGPQNYLSMTPKLQEQLHQAVYKYVSKDRGGYITRFTNIIDEPVSSCEQSHSLDVEQVWAQMREKFNSQGSRLSVHIFNEMLVHCLRAARYDDFFACYAEMAKHRITPNVFTFTYLVKARLWLGQPDMARVLLHEMARYGLTPSMFHFGLVHHTYCRLGMTSEAESLLKEMLLKFQVRPNHILYASLLYAHCRRYEYSAVFRTFEEMEKSGLKPDTETSNYVLLSLFDVGEYAEAMQFFSKMCLEGIKRNSYTYSILVDRMMIRDETTGILEILDDSALPGNTIDSYPFLRVLSFLYSRMEYDRLAECIEKMVDLAVRFDPQTVPFVIFILNRKLLKLSKDNYVTTQQILEKALIDCWQPAGGEQHFQEEAAIWEVVEKYQQTLLRFEEPKCAEAVGRLQELCKNLETVRILYHKLPDVRHNETNKGSEQVVSIADFISVSRVHAPPLPASVLLSNK